MALGEVIRKKRIELGMTQEELASRMGYKHKSSIGKIETGVNDIPLKKVVLLASIFCCSIEELICD